MSAQDVNLVEKITDAIGGSAYGQIADAVVETGEGIVDGAGGSQVPAEPAGPVEDMSWYAQIYHETVLPMYSEHLAPLVDMVPWGGLLAAGLTLFFVIGGMNEIASGRG